MNTTNILLEQEDFVDNLDVFPPIKDFIFKDFCPETTNTEKSKDISICVKNLINSSENSKLHHLRE